MKQSDLGKSLDPRTHVIGNHYSVQNSDACTMALYKREYTLAHIQYIFENDILFLGLDKTGDSQENPPHNNCIKQRFCPLSPRFFA